jgi:hypothetical protein
MSSRPAPLCAPAWNDFPVATFAGQHDTHIDTGEDYATLTLAELFAVKPQSKSKMSGNAFLPSSYYDYDARSHEAQRERGSFVALVGDIDSGDLSLDAVRAATQRFADGAAWLIYSSAHSRDGDRRWRVVIPLDAPIGFADWFDAQTAFFTFMEGLGLPMDRALSRAGQPVYLPNVPFAYKDGTPLRDERGEPIYYQSAATDTDAPGLDIDRGIVAGGIASIRQQRAADDREREVLRKAAAERFASRPRSDGGSIIENFNTSTGVATMLEMCGYEQSPRSSDDWKSPQQTGETYATRIIEGKWVSLSASDAASGLGSKCKSGCFGDAYDLYVHYKHGGDHKNAYRELGREQRGHNVVQGHFRGEDPGWEKVPDWIYEADDSEPDTDPPADFAGDAAPPEPNTLGFNILDWSTDRFMGKAPPIEWLCEGTIPQGVPALLAAMGGVGKSFIALDLALEIATAVAYGQERKVLGGRVIARGSVVVLNAEDSKDSVHRRLEAIDTGGRREGANGRVFIVPLPEVGGPMPLVAGGGGQFLKTEKFEALLGQLGQIPDLKLVIIDPLQAFVTADISKDPAAGQFMWSAFAQICARTGATVLAAHHMRKDGAAKIATADDARETIRGSTALVDGARATYALWTASEEDTLRICNEAGVQPQRKRVVHGAVVKANDQHDLEIHTYVRADNGLLMDATDAGRRVATSPGGMTTSQCISALREVERRWVLGRPFSAASNSPDRYFGGWLQREFKVSKETAKRQMDDWFHNEMIASEMFDRKAKSVGIRVLKWPG